MSVSTICSLWQLTLKSGQVIGLSDHDSPVEIDGVIYAPDRSLNSSVTQRQAGFSADSGTVTTLFDVSELSAASISEGALDEAHLSHFQYDWDAATPPQKLSEGRIGDVKIRGDGFEAEWLGLSSLLDRSTGRVFSRQCDATFGDSRCGLDASNFPDGTICPRSYQACRDQFSNVINFRGFPYILGDDALQSGVQGTSRRDGGSRYKL